jgi:CheY-like chemotaxis protein
MRGGRILVVDDEREVQLVLEEYLRSKGYEVVLADDGVAALEALERIRPDLVLLDMTMPEMDGMETLRRIIERYPGLPVIMVTANADIEITSKVLQMGAADYVPKPFDLAYLGQAVSIQMSAVREP